MKKKINRKKLLIVLTILIIIIGGITFFIVKHIKSNMVYVAPNTDIEELKPDDGMVKYENNVNEINIKDRKIKKIDGKPYIIIEIENTTEEDKFDLPIGIEFINSDGDVIYNTGNVVKVLLKGMTDEVYAVITPEIAKLVEEKKIDHIVIKELQ